MRIRIFLLLLFYIPVYVYSATLPGDNTISLSPGSQISPAISNSTSGTLVVWSDSRSNPYGFYEYETGKDIYGIRIDAAGNLLDTLPLPLVTRRANQENPRVAWNGTNWLVVYESYGVHGAGAYYQKSLEAIRVSPAGVILDAEPIQLYGLTPNAYSWDVASDGNNWVVAQEGTSASLDIIAIRISSAGVVLDPPIISLVKATYYSRMNLKLAYAGGVFLLTFNDAYNNGMFETSAVRFDSNLNLLTPLPVVLFDSPIDDLTANGTQFFAVRNQQLPDFSMAVTGTRISTSGQKLDGAGKNISGAFPHTYDQVISTAFDGINYRVTWAHNNGVRIAHFSTAGAVLDPGGVSLSSLKTGPLASSGNAGVQIVWVPYTNNQYDVMSANISSSNVAGAVRELSTGTPQQLRSDIAFGSAGSMVVYLSNNASQKKVLAQPLDSAGNAVTTQPVQLDIGDNTNGPGAPNVAWNGSYYLVSWSNASGVVAQRLSANGTKIDASPFMVMTPAFGPADVAALGSDFLVVARKFGYTPEFIYAIGARVRGSDRAVLDSIPLAFNSVYVRTGPAVTTLNGQWVVAFHSNVTHDNSTSYTLGSLVSSTGSVTNFQIHGPFSTAGGNGIFEVGLASSGSVALMVQSQELSSGVETDLFARTITNGGTVGPVVNLTPWIGNQYRPRVSWDGTNFVVAYQEQKNRVALHTLDQLDARSDLFGMRVTTSGAKVDPQGFVVSGLAAAETDPSIASFNGVSLLAGSVMKTPVNLSSYRITYFNFGTGGNRWPVAVITANTTEGDISLSVNFNSSGSVDPDGSIASYAWNFGDGGTSTQANPSHLYTAAGEWLTTLTVTDNLGAKTTQSVRIVATLPNQPPVASASANKTSGNAPLDVILYADGSYDPDGFTGNLEWTFSDGNTYYGSPAYHTIMEQGVFTATLRVYDSRGASSVDTVTINVGGANIPPIANASASPLTGVAPLSVAFSSAGSSDPDGTIIAYHWDFGNAIGSANQANPTYLYNSPGTYTAVLTVTDSNNVSSSDSVVITVNQTSTAKIRSSNIALSGTVVRKKANINGQVTVVNSVNAPVANAAVTIRWRKPAGTTVTQTANTNASGIASFNVSGGLGTYTLTVTNIVKTNYTFDATNSVLTKSITK